MTLHEAIIEVLQSSGSAMSANDIAVKLNQKKQYVKGNRSAIDGSQVSARVNKYPNLFYKDNSLIWLRGESASKPKTERVVELKNRSFVDTSTIKNSLLKEKSFKDAFDIDEIVPNRPGIYCIKIRSAELLPAEFSVVLKERQHLYLYVGIATKSLKVRFLEQELRARGHGTFFRSLGAVLGYRPEKGSLKDKKNKNNYTFSPKDEGQIIKWINANLLVNWIEYKGDIKANETKLIEEISSLLNIDKNPLALKKLKDLRNECREIANQ